MRGRITLRLIQVGCDVADASLHSPGGDVIACPAATRTITPMSSIRRLVFLTAALGIGVAVRGGDGPAPAAGPVDETVRALKDEDAAGRARAAEALGRM